MAAVTICSDLGAPQNKVSLCFHYFPSICHEVIWPDAMILVFWMLSFKPTFSLSSFSFIRRLFSSSRTRIRWGLKGRRNGSSGAVEDFHVGVTNTREYSKLGCVSYIFMNFANLYFAHGSSHSFPVFIEYNSCNPVSNALVELTLSAWTIYRSVIYVATTDL